MTRRSKSGFIVPFILGTVFGAVSGITAGALLGHRLFAAMLHVWSLFGRDDEREPPFDLLLQ